MSASIVAVLGRRPVRPDSGGEPARVAQIHSQRLPALRPGRTRCCYCDSMKASFYLAGSAILVAFGCSSDPGAEGARGRDGGDGGTPEAGADGDSGSGRAAVLAGGGGAGA